MTEMAVARVPESSAEERAPTGLPELDGMLEGGFLTGSLITLTGRPGTGKTIFGSHFLYHGARRGRARICLGPASRSSSPTASSNSASSRPATRGSGTWRLRRCVERTTRWVPSRSTSVLEGFESSIHMSAASSARFRRKRLAPRKLAVQRAPVKFERTAIWDLDASGAPWRHTSAAERDRPKRRGPHTFVLDPNRMDYQVGPVLGLFARKAGSMTSEGASSIAGEVAGHRRARSRMPSPPAQEAVPSRT